MGKAFGVAVSEGKYQPQWFLLDPSGHVADAGLGLSIDDMLAALELLAASSARQQIAHVREELERLVRVASVAHELLRLAWIEAVSYSKSPPHGGTRGWTRLIHGRPDLEAHPLLQGVDETLLLLQEVKAQAPSLSWADLVQLAGSVALESLAAVHTPFRWGRLDSTHLDTLPTLGHLPDRTRPSLVRELATQWGLLEREVVALAPLLAVGQPGFIAGSDYYRSLSAHKVPPALALPSSSSDPPSGVRCVVLRSTLMRPGCYDWRPQMWPS